MTERRAVRRVTQMPPLAAKLKTSLPARVLDISARGAQIEVMNSLKPNVTCELRLRLEDADITLRGWVRRCRAWGFGVDDREQRVLLYRAGLEFDNVPAEILKRLKKFLPISDSGEFTPVGPAGETARPAESPPGAEPPATPVAPPRPAPSRGGPVKIRISSEHVRKILDRE